MRVSKLDSDKLVFVKINKYKINWEGKSRSKIQRQVKDFLYSYWKSAICLEEFLIPGSKLRLDFVNLNKKIIVEVDGQQHTNYTKFFHGSRSGFLGQIKRDYQKEQWAKQNEFIMIRLDEKDVGLLSYKYIQDKFGVDI